MRSSGRSGTARPVAATGAGSRTTSSTGCAGPDPGVVATVEDADVVDAGVAQDERRAGGRDLAGTPARPLLVGLALGVPAVEDDRRVRA